jgi:hypothetical protein
MRRSEDVAFVASKVASSRYGGGDEAGVVIVVFKIPGPP